MVRSKLKNKYNKSRSGENWGSYKKQRNFCMNLLGKTKKDYFNDLHVKNITDNKAFWKTMKPYFSNKGLNSSSLILPEKNKIITNDHDIANIMNNYFTVITNHLNIKVTRKGDIPAKILKDSLSMCTKELTTIINNCFKDGLYPNQLKLADVSFVSKKDDDLNKENYRSVSILSHMSKVFQRIFYQQIGRFMTSKFSPFLCRFRKSHNSQYLLLKMIEV